MGERDAMVIENFLWDLKRHVDASTISEGDKVFLASLYLTGLVKMWWCLRVEDTSQALVTSWAT